MPSPNPNHTRHRTRIVAEAVVSAYIHEISQPSRPRERGDVHTDLVAAPAVTASNSPHARPLGRELTPRPRPRPRRRRALELAA